MRHTTKALRSVASSCRCPVPSWPLNGTPAEKRHKGAGDDVTISVQGTCLEAELASHSHTFEPQTLSRHLWVPHGLKGDDLDLSATLKGVGARGDV